VTRDKLARTLARWGMIERLMKARRRLRVPLLTVLTYHRVTTREEVGELDPCTLDADIEGFEAQLDFIVKHFNVISMAELARAAEKELPPNPLLLTFDDGYRDNFEVVLPALKRRSLRATFFIVTSYPETGRLYWWDRIALLVHRAEREPVELETPRLVLRPVSDPAGTRKGLLRLLKRTPGIDPDLFTESLARQLGVTLDAEEERVMARRTIMSWEQILALRDGGMDLESHSHRHRVFATLTDAELAHDLRQSREIMYGKLGTWPRALAYPTGREPCARDRAETARAGFELAFTNGSGIGEMWRLRPFEVPRIAVDGDLSPELFRAFVTLPYLSCYSSGPA
jgi:peptidoglycan/xylan/chitin deacetylase (PgdA/CDA1 family)